MIFQPPHNIQAIPTPLLWVRRGWRVPWQVSRARQNAAVGPMIYAGAETLAASEAGAQNAGLDAFARVTPDGAYRVTPDGALRITGYALGYTEQPRQDMGISAAQTCTLGGIIYSGMPEATVPATGRQAARLGVMIYAAQAFAAASRTARQTATVGAITHLPQPGDSRADTARQTAAPGAITYTLSTP